MPSKRKRGRKRQSPGVLSTTTTSSRSSRSRSRSTTPIPNNVASKVTGGSSEHDIGPGNINNVKDSKLITAQNTGIAETATAMESEVVDPSSTNNDNETNTDTNQNNSKAVSPAPPTLSSSTTTTQCRPNQNNNTLILTSSKRNGLFECDICSTDISHVPRIKCAVNADYDVCLDCFTKFDHSSLFSKTKQHKKSKVGSGGEGEEEKRGKETIVVAPLSKGYRVADSTRFLLFPSLRGVEKVMTMMDMEENVVVNTDSDQVGKVNRTSAADGLKKDTVSQHVSPTSMIDGKGEKVQKNSIDQKTTHDANEGEEENASKRRKIDHDENDQISTTVQENSTNDLYKDSNGDNKNQMMDVDDESTHIQTDIASDHTCENKKEDSSKEANEEKSHNGDNDETKKSVTNEPFKQTDEIMQIENKDMEISAGTKVKDNETNQNQKQQSEENDNMDVYNDQSSNVESQAKQEEEAAPTTQVSVKDDNMKIDTEPTIPTATGKIESFVNKSSNPDDHDVIISQQISNVSKTATQNEETYVVTDDPRYMWSVEEDLRLLDAISTFGLGNWADISEEVSGNSRSVNKTPKRCMERYIDDFLGRYGHILPEYTMIKVENAKSKIDSSNDGRQSGGDESLGRKRSRPTSTNGEDSTAKAPPVARRTNNTEYCVVKTSSLPGYDKIWPSPYIPPVPNVKFGDDVGRDHAVRCEQAYVKATTGGANNEEAKVIQKEMEAKLNKPGGPTVLPPRPEDVEKLPGAELAGYMPRRGDFDLEWENDADKLLEDMEFSPDDTTEERDIKIKVIEIYNSKLDEREKRKQFLKDYDLLDYRKKQREDRKLPADERDLVNRMRLFARFHSAEEHNNLVNELLRAKRLRKEIARLQMYQRMGFTSLVDVERFELDRNRKESHRVACRQKEEEQEEEIAAAARAAGEREATAFAIAEEKETYHRQYRNSDRKNRRSINRNGGSALTNVDKPIQDGPVDLKETDVGKIPPLKSDVSLKKEEIISSTGDVSLTTDSNKELVGPKTAKDTSNHKTSPTDLLSTKEINFCERMDLQPKLYLKAKKVLLEEALTNGILDDETKSRRKSVVKIDVRTKGDIVRFIMQSGWIPNAK